jgi:hypothetical protein
LLTVTTTLEMVIRKSMAKLATSTAAVKKYYSNISDTGHLGNQGNIGNISD